jgi:hypothetical protein
MLQLATLTISVEQLHELYGRLLYSRRPRRAGYRTWVSLLRVPVMVGMCLYLDRRRTLIDYHYLPRWEAGWRPWHPSVLLELPRMLLRWDSRRFILLRHRMYCNVFVALGHGKSLCQRAYCAAWILRGRMTSWYQRAYCAAYRLRGHAKSACQRAYCAACRLRGHAKSACQRAYCAVCRIRGHVGSVLRRGGGGGVRAVRRSDGTGAETRRAERRGRGSARRTSPR